jgi:hypothetical protein
MTREQSPRRACEALVAALDLPDPFDLAEMCARLGNQRGRPIVLMATPMALGNLCGLWLGTAKADYVFYEQDTSQLHQQHIVFHELGHILRRHVPKRVLGADLARALAPGVEIDHVERVLGRDTYSDSDEYEAELIATLTLRRISRQHIVDTPMAVNPSADSAITRIARSLSRGDGQ